MDTSITFKDIAILAAFVAQLGVVFYWGGSTNEKVDNLQGTVNAFIVRTQSVNDRQDRRLQEMSLRISDVEAICVADNTSTQLDL